MRQRRAARGCTDAIYVLNPEGLGDIENNLRWDPVAGCQRPAIAARRAGYLLAGSPKTKGVTDRDFWEGNSWKVLRCFLYAAAVANKDFRDVAFWAFTAGNEEPLGILDAHPETPDGWAAELRQIITAPDRTRDSVYLTLSGTFRFMADPAVGEAVLPGPGDKRFNVRRFLQERGTLYLLGKDREFDSVSPLFTALSGHIFDSAEAMAEDLPTGRLDPPLLLALDEAANICPVPLERWTSTAGGHAIPMIVSVQSRSQLFDRWGQHAANTIWDCCTVKMIFRGLTVPEDLDAIERMCGMRDERYESVTTSGKETSRTEHVRQVPVLSRAEITRLAKWRVLLLHSDIKPAIARLTPVWKRRDVRRCQRRVAAAESPLLRPSTERMAEVVDLRVAAAGGSDTVAGQTARTVGSGGL